MAMCNYKYSSDISLISFLSFGTFHQGQLQNLSMWDNRNTGIVIIGFKSSTLGTQQYNIYYV